MIFTSTNTIANNSTRMPATTAIILVGIDLRPPRAGATPDLECHSRWTELPRLVKNWDDAEAALGRGLACADADPDKVPGAFVDCLEGGNVGLDGE